jgi:hypothetical protein
MNFVERVTVVHLTRPELRAGNKGLANACGHGWEVRNIPDDGSEHPRAVPCPVCTGELPIETNGPLARDYRGCVSACSMPRESRNRERVNILIT